VYFKNMGNENTNAVITSALQAAVEKGINHIVVASSSGATARLLKNDKGVNIVMVSHAYGSNGEGKNELSDEARSELQKMDIKVLTTTHVLSGAERGISKVFGGINPVEIIAQSLRMLGHGTKVCVEVSVMALDAGMIPYGQPVIAIGGSSKGADTALILTPSHANRIFDTKIHEVICKPSLY